MNKPRKRKKKGQEPGDYLARQKRHRDYSRNVLFQLLIQSVAIIITAVGSFMFMTWIIQDILNVNHIYISAGYEIAGTLLMMMVVLVSTNTYFYRKRIKEVDTLSAAIELVAQGDFTTKIEVNPKDPISNIYEDFNKMTAELASVAMLRNDFINSYSHEFKTPVASINGFAELLLEKEVSEEDRATYLEIIRDESARLSKLTSDTLLLSRLMNQQIMTDTEEYDLGEQLRQCSILLSNAWLSKNIEFSADFIHLRYNGNKDMLQHLWINLIGNAIKFTPDNGEISVTVTGKDDNAIVIVADTGEGMSEETLKHLFEPYYQGDASRSIHGLGLGLAIAKRITELHKGSITVKSRLGEGSEFTVTLPLHWRYEEGKEKEKVDLGKSLKALNLELHKLQGIPERPPKISSLFREKTKTPKESKKWAVQDKRKTKAYSGESGKNKDTAVSEESGKKAK